MTGRSNKCQSDEGFKEFIELIGASDSIFSLVCRFFHKLRCGVAILDLDYNFLYVSELYAQILDVSRGHLVGRHFFDLFGSPMELNIFEQVVASNEAYRGYDYPLVYRVNAGKDGQSVRYYDWMLVPLAVCGRQPQWLLLVQRDVTARRMRETAPCELQSDVSALSGVIDVQLGRFICFNPAFSRALGYSCEELQGTSLQELIDPKDRELLEEQLSLLRKGQSVKGVRLRLRRKDSDYRSFYWSLSAISEEGIAYLVGRDITDELQWVGQTSYLERVRLVGEMATVIGHEMRNPLSSIRGFLQLLLYRRDWPAREEIENAIRELDRTSTVVDRFLDLAGESPKECRRVNLNGIVEELQPYIQVNATEGECKVMLDVHPLPDMSLDREEMMQLVLHLCRGILEAIGRGGSLVLRTGYLGGKVILLVRGIVDLDHHDGEPRSIRPEDGQLSATSRILFCQWIVDRYQGSIAVYEEDLGLSVVVKLPVRTTEEKLEADSQ
ncbi:MAG: PAS domain S-box protein [Firmicutes bacterium]|nr:PAS domain S-box protein [Bacillota bacterium]